MRKYGFCTYARSLTNQINAVIHSRISDSIGHTWPSCVGDDLHAERVGEQSQSLQVQGVIQTSLSSHPPPVRLKESVEGELIGGSIVARVCYCFCKRTLFR